MYNCYVYMEVVRSRYRYKKNQPTKKESRLKRYRIHLLVIFFVGIILSYSCLALNKPVSAVTLNKSTINKVQPSLAEIIWPSVGQGAIGDRDDGVYQLMNNSDKVAPIASMSKLITALVILEKSPIEQSSQGEIYTITQDDINIYYNYVVKLGSVMPVQLGQKITQYDLLQGLLLPSGNNAADYLAVWKFGSIENYKKYANEYLARHDLSKTHVDDASGFSPQTVSSPSDMIKIGQLALQNETISQIVIKQSAVIPGSGEIKNVNRMLTDQNVVGLKTGSTDEAGKCLIFAVKHGPNLSHTFIGVIMGQSNWSELYSSARSMTQSALANFGNVEVLSAQTSVGNAETPWGESSNLIIQQPLEIYGWKSKSYETRLDIETLKAPKKSGEKVGKVYLVNNSNISQDIFLENSLSRPDIIWRLTNYW